MKIVLDYTKSLQENASLYFEKSKKSKKKLQGVKKALEKTHDKIKIKPKQTVQKVQKKLEWYERFHWFKTSSDMLAIGGKDANTNELLVKKHTLPDDVVFHTDMAGSPFFILKTQGKIPTEQDLAQVAQMTACYSRGWQKGFGSVAVFHVKPEQVSKEANPGEHLAKGSFMIRGKTTYMHPELRFTIGVKEGKVVCGTLESVSAQTSSHVTIVPGVKKASDLAKQIAKLGCEDLDEIIRMLPTGNSSILR